MKIISARWRRNGFHGRVNLGQYPVLTGQESQDDDIRLQQDVHRDMRGRSGSVPGGSRVSNVQGRSLTAVAQDAQTTAYSIPGSMPLSEIDRKRANFSVDLLSLSTLTLAHVGQSIPIYFDSPIRLVSLLRHQKASYLSHVPSRLGYDRCLDCAASALLAKAEEVLKQPTPGRRTLYLSEHGKALRVLQEYLSDPARLTQPDVLCATELLGIVEASWLFLPPCLK